MEKFEAFLKALDAYQFSREDARSDMMSRQSIRESTEKLEAVRLAKVKAKEALDRYIEERTGISIHQTTKK